MSAAPVWSMAERCWGLVGLHEHQVFVGGVGAPVIRSGFGLDALGGKPLVDYERP